MNRQRLCLIAGAAAMALTSWHARAQSAPHPREMQIPEFRQVLSDAAAYLDAHAGTDLQKRFAAVPDSAIERWYSAVPNPREFQRAVAALKQQDAAAARDSSLATNASLAPLAVSPTCGPPNTIIDNSPGAACTPAYPDPSVQSWKNMVTSLYNFGALPSNVSFAQLSPMHCNLTAEANLQLVNLIFQGLTNVTSLVCQAIPTPGDAICFLAAVDSVSIANQAANGLWTSCAEQDGLVNAAELDAGFRNTITIYNSLKGLTSDVSNGFLSLNSYLSNLTTLVNNDYTSILGNLTTVSSQITNLTNATHGDFTSLNNHVTTVTNTINGGFTTLDAQLTNVDNQIASEASALDAHMAALFNQLAGQVGQGTALLNADLIQAMKLEMTPNGQRIINPAILTCTGTNCPNVLAACAAAGCSWNNVGPLP